jgi:hypothetical protein
MNEIEAWSGKINTVAAMTRENWIDPSRDGQRGSAPMQMQVRYHQFTTTCY